MTGGIREGCGHQLVVVGQGHVGVRFGLHVIAGAADHDGVQGVDGQDGRDAHVGFQGRIAHQMVDFPVVELSA